MENRPFVSIIVPVYNSENTIDHCLDSLLRLDYSQADYEIIVIDDGSTNGTREMLKKYEAKVTVLENKTNRGPSASRNRGIQKAKGQLVGFLDADCTVPPHWLRRLTEHIQSEDIVGVSGYHKPTIPKTRFGEHLLHIGRIQFRRELTKDLIVKRPKIATSVDAIPISGSILKKEKIEQVGYFDETLKSGEDLDLCWRIVASQGRLMLVPDTYMVHRLRPNLRAFMKQLYWYGEELPHLLLKHPKKMKMLIFFYISLIIGGVLSLNAVFSGSLLSIMILGILMSLPLFFYFPITIRVMKQNRKNILFSIEHIALQYLKTIANSLGIVVGSFRLLGLCVKSYLRTMSGES